MQQRSGRNGVLDVLKFLFALQILLHHSRQLFHGLTLFSGGYIGVVFFFIAAGFNMAGSAAQVNASGADAYAKATLQYMKRRLLRILPYYVPAFLFCFVVAEIAGPTSLHQAVRDAAGSVFGFGLMEMAGFASNVLLGGSWFLSAMLLSQFVLYPLLLRFRSLFSEVAAPLIAIFLFGFLSKNYSSLGMPLAGTPYYCAGFLEAVACLSLGVACRSVSEALKRNPPRRAVSAALQAVCYAAAFAAPVFIGKTALDFVWALLLGIAVTLTATTFGGSFSGSKFVGFLGGISFPLYLTHFTVLQVLSACAVKLSAGLVFCIYLGGSLVAAYLCMALGKRIDARIPPGWR